MSCFEPNCRQADLHRRCEIAPGKRAGWNSSPPSSRLPGMIWQPWSGPLFLRGRMCLPVAVDPRFGAISAESVSSCR
jgi:hypothetical protein